MSRPRLSRGSCHTPDPRRSQLAPSSSEPLSSESSTVAIVDYDSGVVFSGLYTASGERITTHEFQTKPHRVLAPTLFLVIPDSNTSSSSLPSFALTVPSPISPTFPSSPIPAPSPFTREAYLAAAVSAPSTSRVPSLPPKRCPHMLYLLPSHCCARCELQQLACEIWWGSRGAMLCAPQVPAAACTPKMRAVYYALGLPFGRLERSCVDLDAVTAISFMRQSSRSRRCSQSSDTSIKSKPVVVTRVPAPARILRVFVRRACHVLSAPTRVPMIPIRTVPRRRVIVR